MVDGNTVDARGVVVARGVILAVFARIENGVHKEMWHSVRKRREHVSELPVNLPHLQSLGYLLIAGGVVVVLVEVAVGAITIDVSLVEVASIVHPCERLGTCTEE